MMMAIVPGVGIVVPPYFSYMNCVFRLVNVCHSETSPQTGRGNPSSSFASGGLFSFNSERKEGKKRRQKLRFWISLRGFTWFLSCQNKPRERCAAEISPKCCTVSASLFAAADFSHGRTCCSYISEQKRQRSKKQRQYNISVKFPRHNVRVAYFNKTKIR